MTVLNLNVCNLTALRGSGFHLIRIARIAQNQNMFRQPGLVSGSKTELGSMLTLGNRGKYDNQIAASKKSCIDRCTQEGNVCVGVSWQNWVCFRAVQPMEFDFDPRFDGKQLCSTARSFMEFVKTPMMVRTFAANIGGSYKIRTL